MFQIAILIAGVVIAVLGVRVMSKGELQVSRKTWWRGAPVYAVGGGVVALGVAVVAAALLVVPLMVQPVGQAVVPQPAAPPKLALFPEVAAKNYTRRQFRPLVLGKGEAAVKELLGPPRSTTTTADGQTVWHYRGVVVEVDVGKGEGMELRSDQDTQLVFADGVVADTIYNWPK